ncbi:3'-5' exonuclease [Bifidobacterium sp. ESL0784]|uniref:3'-5' exonuclease n=1 Tax=Bifidobacterium sp. ESL0784 TaxID=2983231 RepID=UPI0023F63403|nr:3'-5' exonuclease [Bifidobacterium sp. ESL0784]MDF7641507.1 3'-5' exonuclease [Bifidobacterium sp. ESL0784]
MQTNAMRIKYIESTHQDTVRYILDTEFITAARTADCAVIDTETTGFGLNPRLLDIGVVLIENDQVTATLSQLVNPEVPIDAGAAAVNHITREMLDGQPTPGETLPAILESIRTLPLMGHNLDYDIRIINNEAALVDVPGLKPQQVCDTRELSEEMFPGPSVSHTLESLLDRLGVHEPEQHRALADALQTWQAYQLLSAMNGPCAETDEQHERAYQRGRAKTRNVLRAHYLEDRDTDPVNDRPEGMELEGQGGENLCDSSLHQEVLRKYPRGSYFWVSVEKDYIHRGKYKGYPTIYVFLDGEEIGFLGEPIMSKHWGQIPDGPVIARAHTSVSVDETSPYKARIELPKAHEPVNLEPYKR